MGTAPTAKHEQSHNKLSRVPSGYRISKRPLHHPSIPSPRSSADKVIYISTKTPFVSAVKRVQKLLDHADAREAQSALAAAKARPNKRKDVPVEDYVGRAAGQLTARRKEGAEGEGEVVIKGTGRAIEKTLSIAGVFRERLGYKVVVRTSSVEAIDDIVEPAEAPEDQGVPAGEVPTSRIRFTSVLEARISRDL